MLKQGKSKNKKHQNGHNARDAAEKGGKKKYTRSTAVGRLLKHIDRSLLSASLAADRLNKWKYSEDGSVLAALAHLTAGSGRIKEARALIDILSQTNWTPPKKQAAPAFKEGDSVKIVEKHQSKYLQIYPKGVITRLTVSKILETGEVAVRHNDASPFLVAKRHIEKRASA